MLIGSRSPKENRANAALPEIISLRDDSRERLIITFSQRGYDDVI
ncbi:hypothetical protein [Paramixta manurensis]